MTKEYRALAEAQVQRILASLDRAVDSSEWVDQWQIPVIFFFFVLFGMRLVCFSFA